MPHLASELIQIKRSAGDDHPALHNAGTPTEAQDRFYPAMGATNQKVTARVQSSTRTITSADARRCSREGARRVR